eukprot:TRINITY_DN68526_c0_g1_i1.p1 TRINITY_DN68526_c0_g1~~TRINITY_DN68526_c0_g1_i1.p1  ORF type:complete len:351 (-),score=48.00 TRINITY_DN68526_c0_g1_i1:103-1155(-)
MMGHQSFPVLILLFISCFIVYPTSAASSYGGSKKGSTWASRKKKDESSSSSSTGASSNRKPSTMPSKGSGSSTTAGTGTSGNRRTKAQSSSTHSTKPQQTAGRSTGTARPKPPRKGRAEGNTVFPDKDLPPPLPAVAADGFDNAYSVMGVPQDATDRAIRSAYRKLAMLWHPDHLPPAAMDRKDVKEAFPRISRAYQTLSTPALRSRHDREIRDPTSRRGDNDAFRGGWHGSTTTAFEAGGVRFNFAFSPEGDDSGSGESIPHLNVSVDVGFWAVAGMFVVSVATLAFCCGACMCFAKCTRFFLRVLLGAFTGALHVVTGGPPPSHAFPDTSRAAIAAARTRLAAKDKVD